jgi:hypothetical protein
MGRSLLWEYTKIDPNFTKELSMNPNEKAKLTVVNLINDSFLFLIKNYSEYQISDAAHTEIYTIERQHIHLIPEYIRVNFFGLKSNDFN